MSDWKSADTPPEGGKGLWTREVVAVTNFGSVYRIAYFHGDDGGVWQRPAAFQPGEVVVRWTEFPDDID